MRNLFQDGLNQMWFNAQKMEIEEREEIIKYITELSKTNGSFVQYHSKYLLAQLIHNSEPYFNETGRIQKVKEFENLAWYDEKGLLIFEKIMS